MGKKELLEGGKAPDFRLASSDGGEVALKDFKGRKAVILYFYPKDNTPGCTVEACDFRDGIRKFKAKETVVLGVSFDDLEAHERFIEKFDLSFPLLYDTDKKAAKAYGVYKEKNMYGRKFMGIERSTFLIDKTGKLVKIYRKVKVKDHVKQLLKDLGEL